MLSFGRHNSKTDDRNPNIPDDLGTVISDKLWINQVKVGLNYKLGGQ